MRRSDFVRAESATACAVALAVLPSATRAQTLATIRVALIPIEADAEIFYAQEMGFAAKAGIDFAIQASQNGPATEAAVVSGAVDVGISALPSLAVGHYRSLPFVIIAPGSLYTAAAPTTALVVAASSSIRTAKDLSGKIVAVAGLNAINDYAARAWIQANGGNLPEVKFIELGFPAMVAAVGAGRVDAASVSEPFATIAKHDGLRVLGYPWDAVAKNFAFSAYFTTSGWAASHPDVVRRFAGAIHAAALWANDGRNDAASGAILAKYTKIDPAVIATMTRVRFAEQLSVGLFQPGIDLAARYDNFASFPAQELLW